jgi:Mg-chelatase subunit ChlD
MLEQDWPPSRLLAAMNAACDFVQAAEQNNPDNEIAIGAFDQAGQVVSPFVPARVPELPSRIRGITTGSSTNITAGLLVAETLFASVPPASERMVLLLTDGVHNVGPDPYDVADRLKQANVRIETIGIANEQAVNAVMLKALASTRPDGTSRYKFIGDPRGLVEHVEKIARRLTL